jgi:D-glucuronyl C5-epimerase C-terminus
VDVAVEGSALRTSVLRRALLLAGLLVAAAWLASPALAGWHRDAGLARRGLRLAVAKGRMLPEEADTYRSDIAAAAAARRRMGAENKANLAAVLHEVAAEWKGYYRVPRALALFSMLDFNARYLSSHPLPAAGDDVVADEGVVYRSFPGQGLQFHPLGEFSRLNRLLNTGQQDQAATLANALVERAVPSGRGLTWEYYFSSGGPAPWTSGMVQAVAARAFAVEGELDIAAKAYTALGPLLRHLEEGPWVKLYGFSRVAVLNAQLQAIVSLSKYGDLTQDPNVLALRDQLLRIADALFPRFDTGAWSLYSLGGSESPLHYHRYDILLLRKLAAATGDPVWSRRARRFNSYRFRRPRVRVDLPQRSRSRSARIHIWISKISTVTVAVGRARTTLVLSRGSHGVAWDVSGLTPRRYRVTVTATDLCGNVKVVHPGSIRVRRK